MPIPSEQIIIITQNAVQLIRFTALVYGFGAAKTTLKVIPGYTPPVKETGLSDWSISKS